MNHLLYLNDSVMSHYMPIIAKAWGHEDNKGTEACHAHPH